jgi:DNA-binding protein H-NS
MKSTADPSDTPEKQAAVLTIRKLMAFWQIEPHELCGVVLRPRVAAPAAPARPHYRHPITQQEWNGIGAQPDWLRDALLREGYTVEALRRCAQEATAD